jgi:phosphatidylglycerol:prolipoprotein diacylglycerol transferase
MSRAISGPTRFEIPAVWNGGMSFHGGLLGVVAAVYLLLPRQEHQPLSLGDIASAATPFGLFFGRIANFINSEVVGRQRRSLGHGVSRRRRRPASSKPALRGGARGRRALHSPCRRHLSLQGADPPGTIFGLFLVFYGLFRSFVEFFREPHPGHPLDIGVLTPGIVYSIPMILLGLWLIRRAQVKPAIAP